MASIYSSYVRMSQSRDQSRDQSRYQSPLSESQVRNPITGISQILKNSSCDELRAHLQIPVKKRPESRASSQEYNWRSSIKTYEPKPPQDALVKSCIRVYDHKKRVDPLLRSCIRVYEEKPTVVSPSRRLRKEVIKSSKHDPINEPNFTPVKKHFKDTPPMPKQQPHTEGKKVPQQPNQSNGFKSATKPLIPAKPRPSTASEIKQLLTSPFLKNQVVCIQSQIDDIKKSKKYCIKVDLTKTFSNILK